MKNRIAVLTGDIINSQKSRPSIWLKALKKELKYWGNTPKQWEIYRGDSFQLEIRNPEEALLVALRIKAVIKSIKGMDVRIAIGVGRKEYTAKTVTESNGEAFVYSGELLEELKGRKVELAIKSENEKFNREMNLYFRLALIPIGNWTVNSAQSVYTALRFPDRSQEALGKLLGIKQNAVSTRLKRASFDEIGELLLMYKAKLLEWA